MPELAASQLITKRKQLEEKKVVGWSTKEMNEQESNLLVEDTEEMVSWRSFSQEERSNT